MNSLPTLQFRLVNYLSVGRFSDAHLNIEWRESDGPIVAAPTHRGFGMRLLSRALDQFNGTVETSFASTGLVCKMSVTLPEATLNIVPDASYDDAAMG
jgi:two-component sensor histidine kinase